MYEYPTQLVNKTIKSHFNSLKRDKEIGQAKCLFKLKILHVKKSCLFREKY